MSFNLMIVQLTGMKVTYFLVEIDVYGCSKTSVTCFVLVESKTAMHFRFRGWLLMIMK
jgi:hypothetical protein